MTPRTVRVLAAAADLAENQDTTDQAVILLLRYLGLYPAAYGFLYGRLRAAQLVLADQDGPEGVANAIRWAVAG